MSNGFPYYAHLPAGVHRRQTLYRDGDDQNRLLSSRAFKASCLTAMSSSPAFVFLTKGVSTKRSSHMFKLDVAKAYRKINDLAIQRRRTEAALILNGGCRDL